MSGFSNPIVGSNGSLIYPQIKSPNYVAGVSGWTIKKDGTVEFNNGTFRGVVTGGSFAGTNFDITPAGMFFYSGAPALGNLIISIASTGGIDGQGNVYMGGGLAVYSGGQSFFEGISGGLPTSRYATGNLIEGTAGNVTAGVVGAGATAVLELLLSGPKANVIGSLDWAQILFASGNGGGTGGASGNLIYIPTTGAPVQVASWNASGFNANIANLSTINVSALNSGWQQPALGIAGNNTTLTALATVTIPALPTATAGVTSIWEMTLDGIFQGGGVAETFNFTGSLGGTSLGGNALAAVNYGSDSKFSLRVKLQCVGPLGAACQWFMQGWGIVVGTTFTTGLAVTNITRSSLIASTFKINGQWGGAGGAGQFCEPLLGTFRQVA